MSDVFPTSSGAGVGADGTESTSSGRNPGMTAETVEFVPTISGRVDFQVTLKQRCQSPLKAFTISIIFLFIYYLTRPEYHQQTNKLKSQSPDLTLKIDGTYWQRL